MRCNITIDLLYPMRLISILLSIVLLAMTSCTSIDVRPVPGAQTIKSVSIRENPKVAVSDFVDVLVAGFLRHGINARVITATAESKDEYVVTYVAYRKWDMAAYLVDATIRIEKGGEIIASATYHLKGGGGLSLEKWNSTKAKLDPVIDELLQNYR
jgi:hypothetical protein